MFFDLTTILWIVCNNTNIQTNHILNIWQWQHSNELYSKYLTTLMFKVYVTQTIVKMSYIFWSNHNSVQNIWHQYPNQLYSKYLTITTFKLIIFKISNNINILSIWHQYPNQLYSKYLTTVIFKVYDTNIQTNYIQNIWQ